MNRAGLPLEGDSHSWMLVRQYVQARIDLQTEICTALSSSDQDRRDAAARIDELRQLLEAPKMATRTAHSQPTTGSY